MKFFIIDDDQMMIDIQTDLLEDAGHTVVSETSSGNAVARIMAERPDCIVTDLMMPGVDGYQLLSELRKTEGLKDIKIIVVTSKSFKYDRKQVLDLGANGFVAKPIDSATYYRVIGEVMEDRMTLTYWGVRGTLPVAGERALRYGGNTSCVTLSFPNDRTFIFDAGTGIKEFARSLFAQGQTKLDAKVFISHPHWDHINALPQFPHMYIPGNEFQVLGAGYINKGMEEIISGQMDDVYFPITIREFGSSVVFKDIVEGDYVVDGIKVRTMLLSHPGRCLGYRVDYNKGSVCYITDNELFLPGTRFQDENYVKKLSDFVRDADILITDCTYTDDEYRTKVGWGHSCVSQVVELAAAGNVKALHLFHHDPDQDDAAIDRKHELALKHRVEIGAGFECLSPREQERYQV